VASIGLDHSLKAGTEAFAGLNDLVLRIVLPLLDDGSL